VVATAIIALVERRHVPQSAVVIIQPAVIPTQELVNHNVPAQHIAAVV